MPGFGDWIKEKYNKAKEKVTNFVNEVKETCTKIYENLTKSKTEAPKPKTDFRYQHGSGSSSGNDTYTTSTGSGGYNTSNEEIARIRSHSRNISKWHLRVADNAKSEETNISNSYDVVFKSIITKLENLGIDTKSIQKHIDQNKTKFNHVMRDEVNERVNPTCYKWQQLIDDEYATEEEIQNYALSVYKDAQNKLYDTLSKVVEDTRQYIEAFVKKYLEDKKKALESQKQSLINMTQGEEAKFKEIQKLSEEYATMQFIVNEVNSIA